MQSKITKQGNKENVVGSQARSQPLSAVHKPQPRGIAAELLNLQRTHGNRYVQQLLNGGAIQRKCACGGGCPRCQKASLFQTKLKINEPGDRYEQEADRIADRVMRMPEPKIQRLCPECEEELQRQPMEEEEKKKEEETLQTKPLAESITPLIQRQTEPTEEEEKKKEEEETLQTKTASGEPPTVSASLQNQITALRGGGQPLPQSERNFFEPRFGADFSQVRVHAGNQAAEAARAVNARAFTLGRDVVFGAGQYQPRSTEGQRLLAHELTHVVQQNGVSAQKLNTVSANIITPAAKQIQRAASVEPSLPLPAGEQGPPAPLTLPSICVPTTGSGSTRTSSSAIDVYYEKDSSSRNRAEITLRQREAGNSILHTAAIPDTSDSGYVTIPTGIPIADEDHHYELEMVFFNNKGVQYGGLGTKPVIKFEVCALVPAPTGDDLLFAKALYAEGVDAGEFPYVRDLVYNRIDWVANTCPSDASTFGGKDIPSVLKATKQFGSVLGNTSKFQQLETELKNHSGGCQCTTPPRSLSPSRCRLVNAAIQTEAAGNGNSHNYLFLRANNKKDPSLGRTVHRWRYPRGNYYWEMRGGCPINGIVVDTKSLPIRKSPDTGSRKVDSYSARANVTILCKTTGTSVDGNNTWYETDRGGYVAARYVKITGIGPPSDCPP
jgi:hypothetical protein